MNDSCQEKKDAYEQALREESQAQKAVDRFNVQVPLGSKTPLETNLQDLAEAQKNLREKTKERETKQKEYEDCRDN